LTTLGVWSEIADRLVRADSVRSALAFVDRGEAPLGIVYETDALIDKRVRVVDVFPANSHLPIVYPVALTTAAKAEAAGFVEYLRGPAGAMAFKAAGFTPLH
jgi:molybdate transport system substrate-binding protein